MKTEKKSRQDAGAPIFTWLILVLILALAGPHGARAEEATRVITDMVGRKVTVPRTIHKVYCTSPVGAVLIYSLAPGKLLGWNSKLGAHQRHFVIQPYDKLPVVGGWFNQPTAANLEQMLKYHPDLIMSMGTTDATSVATSERLEKQTGIPMVMVTGALTRLDEAYAFVGDLLGARERAKVLSGECRRIVGGVQAKLKTIPLDKRPRVYYAEGPKGLDTVAKGSFHIEMLDFLGAVNVANVPLMSGNGRAPVSLEQLLAWNPEIILVGYEIAPGDPGFYARVHADPAWSQIKAVQKGQVYETPQYPFNWFGRPPSINRLIGVEWLASLLYPETFKTDLPSEVKRFYEMFYHVKLTDADVAGLLQRAR